MSPKPSLENPAKPLTVQDAITETVHRSYRDGQHVPPKAIAQDMNLPLSTVYDLADEHRDRRLRAEEIPALVRATGNALVLDTLERSVGRVAFSLPTDVVSDGMIGRLTGESAKEFGEFLQRLAAVLEDGRATTEEVEQLKRESFDLIRAVCSTVEHVERLDERPLRLRSAR